VIGPTEPQLILQACEREYSPEMISSPWLLLLVGAIGASTTMICVWLVSIRIHNASYVDVAWALGIAGTAVAYALLADGSTLHRVIVAGLGTIWGVRLGTYLLARLAGKEEDGRYQELRRRWAPNANRAFFVFYQAQAGFVLIFSLPFAFVGIAWLCLLTGSPFNLMAQIGLLILVGIVVNNGIVLVYHIHQLRGRGVERDVEQRTAQLAVCDRHGTAHQLDQPAADREAQPRAAALARA